VYVCKGNPLERTTRPVRCRSVSISVWRTRLRTSSTTPDPIPHHPHLSCFYSRLYVSRVRVHCPTFCFEVFERSRSKSSPLEKTRSKLADPVELSWGLAGGSTGVASFDGDLLIAIFLDRVYSNRAFVFLLLLPGEQGFEPARPYPIRSPTTFACVRLFSIHTYFYFRLYFLSCPSSLSTVSFSFFRSQVNKASNLLDHRAEIMARPAKSWFQVRCLPMG